MAEWYFDPSIIIPIGGGVLVIIGILFFLQARKILMLKDRIEKTKSILIKNIKEGPVSLDGTVVPIKKEILKSPFLRQDCVYYSYKIKKLAPKEHSNYWKPYKTGSKSVDFYLEDATGNALINGKHSTFEVFGEFSSAYYAESVPKGMNAFLKENKLLEKITSSFALPHELHFSEATLRPDDWIYVLGYAVKNPNPRKSPEGKAPYLIKCSTSSPLFVFDKRKSELLSFLSMQYWRYFILGVVSILLAIIVMTAVYLSMLV